ncbi:MAG: GPI inositol-deacylase [Nocardiaceae bacterium]|nr:GPI inositol-deacylase [Nocardiaceae bacterium]
MQQPQPTEFGALAELGLTEIGGAAEGIRKVHRAISDRIFGFVGLGTGPGAKPVKYLHDTITDGIYSAIELSTKTAGPQIGNAIDTLAPNSRKLSEDARAAAVIAVVQGLIGDKLLEQGSPLATEMSVRVDGKRIELDRWSLATAYPNAQSHIVVFLHGLVESERAWRLGGRPTYAQRLGEEAPMTGVEIRFNSGLHISENGRILCELLTQLVDQWPVKVQTISLVGHSMGGLVSRSACVTEAPWTRYVRHVVTLGSPHTGAPLEKLAHFGSAALNLAPETRPFATLLRRRSAGIRDLRFGSLVDEDWLDRSPDSLKAQVVQEVPFLPHAQYYFVTAVITKNPRNPLGRVIGDGLVLSASAGGRSRTRTLPFEKENGLHLSKANHFTLLNHGAVYEHLLKWLA